MLPAARQIDMDFDRPVVVPPSAEPEEVVALASFLLGKGWLRAREIIEDDPAALHLPGGMEKAKRKIRRIAQAGRGLILSHPGSKGYRALSEASVPEIIHARRAHLSQANEHRLAVIALDNHLHGRNPNHEN